MRDIEDITIIKEKTRNGYIDFVKGILITFVVWGHVIPNCREGDFYGNPLFKFICSFHMPLFMAVSGYLFYDSINKSRGNFLIKRCVEMLYPAVIWGTMLFVARLLVGYRPASPFKACKDLYGCSKELWFLWSVALNVCGVAAVHKFTKGRFTKLLGYVIVFFCFCFIPKVNDPVLIFMYPCYAIGFVFHEYKTKIQQKVIYSIIGISFLGFILMLMYYNTSHYIYTSGMNPFRSTYGFWPQIGIDIFRWLIAVFGSSAILVALKNIYEGFTGKKTIDFFKYLGTISLEIYVTQKILVETMLPEFMINRGWGGILPENEVIYNFVITPFITGVFIILIEAFVKWTSKHGMISKILFWRTPPNANSTNWE